MAGKKIKYYHLTRRVKSKDVTISLNGNQTTFVDGSPEFIQAKKELAQKGYVEQCPTKEAWRTGRISAR